MRRSTKKFFSFLLSFLIVLSSINFPMVSHADGNQESVSLVLGSLYIATGANASSTKMARSNRYDLSEKLIEVNPGDGVKYSVFCYGEDESYLGWTNWLTAGGYQVLDDTRYVTILMTYVESKKLSSADLASFGSMICVTEAGKTLEVTAITLNASEMNLFVGDTAELSAEVSPSDATNQEITWTSSDESVATVTNGIVNAVAAGTAVITATANNGISATCTVNVSEVPVVEELTIGSLYISTGENASSSKQARSNKYDLSEKAVEVIPGDGVKYAVFCYEEDESYLGWTNWITEGDYQVFDGTRYVIILMAYTDGRRIKVSDLASLGSMICVTEAVKIVDVTTITLSTSELNLYVGDSAELSAEVSPSDATNQVLTWTSSDESVATVANGTVTAVAVGTVTITAAANNGISATCEVSVSERPVVEHLTVGNLAAKTGREVVVTNRARSDMYDLGQYTVEVTPRSDIKYAAFCYAEDGTYLGWTKWLTAGGYPVFDGTRFVRVLMAYADDRDLGEAELADLGSLIQVNKIVEKLTVGNLAARTGLEVSVTNRARSDVYDLKSYAVEITPRSDIKYAAFCYAEDGTYLGWTKWLTAGGYQVFDGTRFIRVLMAYTDDRDLGDAELVDLGSLIRVSEAQNVPTFTVTYNAGQGTFASNNAHTVSVSADAGYFYLDTLEEEPTWENHEFKGWLYEGKYVERVALNADLTLTAQWLETYPLTYDANGGGWDLDSATGAFGATTLTRKIGPGTHYLSYIMNERIEDPVRPGYSFVGWKYGDKIVRKVKVTGPTTVVAVWEGAIAVTYDANGGFWQFDNDPEFTTVTQQEPAGLYYIGWHEPQRAGYEFDCWVVDDEPAWQINLTEPITVKARWRKQVNVTYHPNGGTWDDGSTPRVSSDAYTGNYWVAQEWPHRDGYCFLGWSINAAATTAQTDYDFDLKMDTIFYAIWGANPVVTYDGNGGWFDGGALTKTVERNIGSYRLEGYGVRRDGWEFLGWALSADGDAVYTRDEEIDLTQSMTLYAVWKQYPMVIYDANGGGWGWYEDEEGYIQYHQTWQMHWDEAGHYYYVGMESPEMPGYEFDGWYFPTGGRADDVEILLEDEQTYVVEAHWVKKCTVTYKTTPGGWGWFNGERYEYDTFTREATEGEYQIEGWTPNREGPYKFVGYTTVENGTQAQYTADQKITIHGDLTLYAVWKQLPTIIYDGNGGGWGNRIETEDGYTYDDVVRYDWREPGHVYYVGFEQPWSDGAEFECWVDADGNCVDGDRLDLEDGDVYTFYAKWREPVTVTYKTYIGGYGWYDWDTEEYECTTFDREEWTGDYNLDGRWPDSCNEPYKFLGYAMGHDHYQLGQVDYQPNDHVVLMEDVTFYAVWMRMPTVTYRGNGGGWGGLIETENGGTTYKKTEKMDWREPGYVYYVGFEQPWREGYVFDGWVDAQGNRADDRRIDFTGTTAETFYASWRKEITITYDNGGIGGWGMYNRYSDTYEHTSITNTVWTNEEYRVDGWEPYCGGTPSKFIGYALGEEHANIGQVDYQPGDRISLNADSEDMTLYAIWREVPHVKYDANGGGWGSITEETEDGTIWRYDQTVRYEWRNLDEYYTYIRQENPWREGYEFGGWVDANGASVDNQEVHFYEDSVSRTVYAKWRPKVTVTYDANGGSFFGYDVNTPGETDYVHYRDGYEGEYYFDGWTPFRDDYDFIGWSTTQDGEPLSNPVTLQGSTTFYAVWQAKPVVTYDANGGGWGMEYGENGVTYDEVTRNFFENLGDYRVGREWPDRDGYRFLGWAETATAQTAETDWDTTLTGSKTFYAIWEKLLVVTYNPGPGAKFRDDSTIKTASVDKGSWYPLGWDDELEPLKEGYRFDGWLYNGNAYDRIRVDEDVTLEADWVKTYTLNFDANGGYYADDNSTICTWEVDDGEGYDFWVYEAPIPERDGYLFGGWRLNGVNVNFVEIDGSDVTIYAHWLDENGQPME